MFRKGKGRLEKQRVDKKMTGELVKGKVRNVKRRLEKQRRGNERGD